MWPEGPTPPDRPPGPTTSGGEEANQPPWRGPRKPARVRYPDRARLRHGCPGWSDAAAGVARYEGGSPVRAAQVRDLGRRGRRTVAQRSGVVSRREPCVGRRERFGVFDDAFVSRREASVRRCAATISSGESSISICEISVSLREHHESRPETEYACFQMIASQRAMTASLAQIVDSPPMADDAQTMTIASRHEINASPRKTTFHPTVGGRRPRRRGSPSPPPGGPDPTAGGRAPPPRIAEPAAGGRRPYRRGAALVQCRLALG